MPLPSADFFVETADYATDIDALRAIREPVFVHEQQVPLDLEWDELDPRSVHVLAREAATGRPIGTGRLTPEHRIGRMAVLPDWRSRGVGGALLVRLMDIARERGIEQISLHAQVAAMAFYAEHGFEPYGERFIEAGIAHQSMQRSLQRPAAPARRTGAGSGAAESEFDTLVDCRDALLSLLQAARHRLWIYSRDLDPQLLGDPAALEQLRRIGLSGRGADIRIIVHDPAAAQQARSGLLTLVQRMSSAVQIRRPTEDVDLQYPSAFVLTDAGGYLFRPLGSRNEGSVALHAPGRHRQLLDYFREVWERAAGADELRQLRL